MSLRSRQSAWTLWMILGALAIAVHLPMRQGLLNAFVNESVGAAAVVAVLVGVRLHRPSRPALWYFLAAGQAAVTVGDAMFDYDSFVAHINPYPSVADAFYLIQYPLVAAGLFILIKGRTSGRDRAGLLDAAIIATGLGLLSWVLLMQPLVGDSSRSVVTRLVDVAYPAADVLLVAMLARVLTTPGARTASYRMLAAAPILTLVGDVTFSVLNTLTGYENGRSTTSSSWRT